MRRVADRLERMIARALPKHDRDAVLGDLLEESVSLVRGGRGFRLWAMVRIAVHYHAEPYRDAHQRMASASVALVGLALLWVIPLASSNMFTDPELLTSPLIRVAAALWGASHVTSALATGLFVGRTTVLPDSGITTRWHVGMVLACTAFVAASGFGAGLVSGITLLLAVWMGDIARPQQAAQLY